MEEEEDMEDSPAPLPECDQHDEIIDNQKDEDIENSNANDKVVEKVDNENESPGCNATILESKQVSYPEDLNPDPVKNPFGSDNDKEEEEEDVKDEVVEQQRKEELDIKKESTNPFGSDDDEEEEDEVEQEKPEKAELGQVVKGAAGLVGDAITFKWATTTIGQAAVNTVVVAEIACWFFIGECIGKGSIVGYQV